MTCGIRVGPLPDMAWPLEPAVWPGLHQTDWPFSTDGMFMARAHACGKTVQSI